MILGEKLQEERKKLALTQQELASKMNVSRQTISNWELSRSYPDIESLILLSSLFSVTIDTLLKGDKKMIISLKKRSILSSLFLCILGCLALASSICFIVDFSLTGKFTWSLIVAGSCLFTGIVLAIACYTKTERLLKTSIGITCLLLPLLMTIQYVDSSSDWFWAYGVQLCLVSLIFCWMVILLWRFTRVSIWWLGIAVLCLSVVVNYLGMYITNELNESIDFIIPALSQGILAAIFFLTIITNADKGQVDSWLFAHIRRYKNKKK